MVAPDSVKRGKSHLALAMFLIGAALVGGPYLIAQFGVMAGLKDNAWVILLVAYAGILLKAGLSFLMTKDFRYDKSAYELCVLTMGGILTCLALQLTSNQDLVSRSRRHFFPRIHVLIVHRYCGATHPPFGPSFRWRSNRYGVFNDWSVGHRGWES